MPSALLSRRHTCVWARTPNRGAAVGTSGSFEASFFLNSILTLYAARHLSSTIRAMLLTVLATVMIMTLGLVHPGEFGWPPWVAAEVFTLVLGRVLFAQREAITALQEAREELAGQAVTGARHVLRRDLDEAARPCKTQRQWADPN